MARKSSNLQSYPRQANFLAEDHLFPKPKVPLASSKLYGAIERAFERTLTNKQGARNPLPDKPKELVQLCLAHLRERSDPILSASFLSQCQAEEVFELDAIPHEMQRHRMKIGVFYQYLVIELMRSRFTKQNEQVYDGKKEGDVEAEINTPGFEKGIRLMISVKKSSDTVGGQDIGGVFTRLERIALEDKNLTRPWMGVVCYATPQRGKIQIYEKARKPAGADSPNCEVWSPGFIFPFISGLEANEIYKAALLKIGDYLPFHSVAHRKECGSLLAIELSNRGLIDPQTGCINPAKFQEYVSQAKPGKDVENGTDIGNDD